MRKNSSSNNNGIDFNDLNGKTPKEIMTEIDRMLKEVMRTGIKPKGASISTELDRLLSSIYSPAELARSNLAKAGIDVVNKTDAEIAKIIDEEVKTKWGGRMPSHIEMATSLMIIDTLTQYFNIIAPVYTDLHPTVKQAFNNRLMAWIAATYCTGSPINNEKITEEEVDEIFKIIDNNFKTWVKKLVEKRKGPKKE